MAHASWTVLRATTRSSSGSRARYTTPIMPWPISSWISYRPKRFRWGRLTLSTLDAGCPASFEFLAGDRGGAPRLEAAPNVRNDAGKEGEEDDGGDDEMD